MAKKQILIGLGGVATVGKDTFYSLLKTNLPDLKVSRFAFADNLKRDVEKIIKDNFGLDVWNLSPEEKKIVRPLLVWWGCTKRHIQPDYWIKNLEINFLSDTESDVKVITDVRFENEAKWLHELSGLVIHITRTKDNNIFGTNKIPPANSEEIENDPKVFILSDLKIVWPTVLPERKISDLTEFVIPTIDYIKAKLK